MKIQRVHALHVIVTAHEGAQCDHKIAVVGMRNKARAYYPEQPPAHVTLTWGPSAMLGAANSRSFFEAGIVACDIAEQMARNGGFDE